jgi:hypothetical protein
MKTSMGQDSNGSGAKYAGSLALYRSIFCAGTRASMRSAFLFSHQMLLSRPHGVDNGEVTVLPMNHIALGYQGGVEF